MDHLQAACPAKLQGGFFVEALVRRPECLLHLLLDNHLKGFGRRSAFTRVCEGYLLKETWVAQIRPSRGHLAHVKSPQRIRVVANPKGRKSGSDPASASIVENFAGDSVGKGTITKPFWTVLDDLAINQPTGVSLLLKIESATTEENVNSDPNVGGKELASRVSLCPEVVESSGNFRGPRVSRQFPEAFKSRIVFAPDESCDFAGSTWHPPVDANRAPGLLPIVFAKGSAEFVADLFVMGSDDDDLIIRRS